MEDTKRLARKLTVDYAFVQCIYNMGYCCIMTFASVFLLSRRFTNTDVGMVLTVGSGLAIISQLALTTFADKTQKFALRTIVAAVLFAMTVISLLLWLLPELLLPTAVLYLLLICLLSMQNSLVVSLAIEHINTGVPLNFSLARGVGSFAFALLALFMGFFVDLFGTGIIIPVITGICLVGTVLVATFRKPGKARNIAEAIEEEKASGFFEFSKSHMRFMLVIVSVALMFFSHILINSYTIQIVRHVGGSNSDMGIASSIGGFLELPAMALFPIILKKLKSAGLILKLSGVALPLRRLLFCWHPTSFGFISLSAFSFLPLQCLYLHRSITRTMS